jgi:nucleoside-diphosphate-sugar epimerase
LYGACKHALHGVLEAVATEKNLSAAWARVFFLYGPHEHPERLTASVIRSLLRGDTAQCSHGQQVRDFLYVEDVASAFVALLQSQVSGPVNIASGEGVAVRDLVGKIGDVIGRRDLIRLGERPAGDEPPILVADVTRLRDEVGWKPEYSIDSGLTLAIEWWRENLETWRLGKAECG